MILLCLAEHEAAQQPTTVSWKNFKDIKQTEKTKSKYVSLYAKEKAKKT
jgi:hypothetical protein